MENKKDMSQSFLEQESKRANKKNMKLYLILLFVFIGLVAIIGYGVKDSFDLNDDTSRKLLGYLVIFTGIMLLSVLSGFIRIIRGGANGKDLILPFKENTKEEVGKVIDQEVLEGKVLVDEYMEPFPEGKKPHGERIMLTASYLLLFNGMGKIKAIPREKIYWLCAQVGRKGRSSFIVRLLIFTEKSTFYVDGVEIEHVEKIADKLYQYIPNVFNKYDPFILSYELEALFDKNREAFLKFYEEEKTKM